MHNPILNTDSYKFGHFEQYPPGLETLVSHIAPRWSKVDGVNEVVFLGLDSFLKYNLKAFQNLNIDNIDEAERLAQVHGVPFNREGWLRLHDTADSLPVEIWALPEGTVVPVGTPVLQVFNTDPQMAWVTSYIETALLRAIWYPSTVASISRACRKIILRFLEGTGCENPPQAAEFMLHDFGARGASSEETAQTGGAAHLTQFVGTDNLLALELLRDLYHEDCAGYSVAAAEHSTITSWGPEREAEAYKWLIDNTPANKIISIVADSYDIAHAVRDIFCKELRGNIEALAMRGGRLVVRPDSGDPIQTPVMVVEWLMETFGSNKTSTGHFLLPPYLRVLQGDGINIESLEAILQWAHDRGIAAENFVFGMGGGLLQKVDRDTFGFAMKANAAEIWGSWEPVAKSTPGKTSIGGIITVKPNFAVQTVPTLGALINGDPAANLMKPVFAQGKVYPANWRRKPGHPNETWGAIRARAQR